MASELSSKSSSRNGADVIWLAVHTAEGPTDELPDDPALDSGSARQLLRYFQRDDVRASSHAIADDDLLLDDLVPYSRASWTLRGGNPRSDNIELCGMAGWSRAQWLKHPGLLNNCARWLASRAKARGWRSLKFIGTQGVRDRETGVIGHVNYTEGTGDGTHWDPGPGFPWDYVIPKANAYLTGTPTEEGFMAALTEAEQREILRAAQQINRTVGAGQVSFEGTVEAILSKLNGLTNEVRSNAAVEGDDEAHILARVDEVKTAVEALAPVPAPEA
jgi:hypothetical protein